MMNKKIFIGLILLAILLSFLSYRQIREFRGVLQQAPDLKLEIPPLEPLEFPLVRNQEKEKEFITPDGRLKIRYSGNWLEGGEEILRAFGAQVGPKLAEAEIIFFAFQIDWKKPFPSYLILQKIGDKGVEEVIEAMKKDIIEREGEIEILSLKKENDRALIEARYKIKMGATFFLLRSKGKIILTEEQNYLLTVLSSEEKWPDIEPEAKRILESVERIEI